MTTDALTLISQNLSISVKQVSAVIKLLEDGATIPFIARYRKEASGGLDETEISKIQSELKRITDLIKRRESILNTIREQGKLTDELERQINSTWQMNDLEDIYLPYKPKRKTRAAAAIEKGLEPLAQLIFAQNGQLTNTLVEQYVSDQVPDSEAAINGAKDIIAEWINEDITVRNTIRNQFEHHAIIQSTLIEKKRDEAEKYRDYFDFSEQLKRIPSHRLLAIRRAENEGLLRVSISIDQDSAIQQIKKIIIKSSGREAQLIAEAIDDSYKRLLSSSIETEFRNSSKEKADTEAISVFSENLRQLLMAAPLGEKSLLAIDPGFRTGCKVVCLDAQGNYLQHSTIYPHPPQNEVAKSEQQILDLVKRYHIETIAIGNGTAGRETERFIKSIKGIASIDVYLVNESGASIYSASEVARDEFPELDLTVRGSISIGRRLMDPLAELVKIDAKSIGVGQYQHDVNQDLLHESLDQVVSSAVNQVGVNLNTASRQLLSYVSGIGPKLAASIMKFRQENGKFKSRSDLKKVSGLGAKAFEQCAGFLRIPDGKNPLDASAVHPESYSIVERMAKDLAKPISSLISDAAIRKQIDLSKYQTERVGLPTLKDILSELEKPGRDPRGEVEKFSFADIHDLSDLKADMIVPGIVTNLTKFGAFIDIGIKENGLAHISQLADRYISDPAEVLKIDQKVTVKILEIDLERKRIQLTLKF